MTRYSDRHGRTLPLLATAAAAALLSAGITPVALGAPTTQPAAAVTQPSAVAPNDAPSPLWRKTAAGNPATQPAGRPQFALAPTTQATEISVPAAATQPATTHPAQEIRLEFKDASLSSVVDFLSDALGYTLVKDGPIEGRVSIVSRTPVSPEMALTLLNAALSNNQMAAIRDGRVLKIVSIDKVKKLNIPVNLGADPDEIPDTADWVTWVIPVKNVDAVKLRQDIQPLVGSNADFTANQGSNSLIMTDMSSNIKRIVKIVSKVDQSTAQTSVMRTYTLKYANAASTAKLITTLFGTPDQGQNAQGGGAGGGRGGRAAFQMLLGGGGGGPGGGGGGGGGGSDTGKNVGKVTASADDRTNTVVVIAPSDTQTAIEKLIDKLDSDNTVTAEIKTFTLKYADPASAAKLINSIFQSDAQSTANQGGGGGRFNPFAPPRIQNVSEEDRTVKVTAAAADKTSTLVVSAPSTTMKIIEDILLQLDDDPNQQSAVTIFTLQHADADSAAKLINSIFAGTTSTGSPTTTTGNAGGGGGGRFGGGGGGFGGGGGGGGGGRFGGNNGTPPEISGKAVNVNANSDERTNTVVVTAPPDATRLITSILAKLDSNPSADSSTFIYQLRNGVAADIQNTLNQLFGTSTTGGVSNSSTANRGTSSSGFSSSTVGSNTAFGGGGAGGRGGGGSGLGSSGSGAGGSLGSSGTNNIQRTPFNGGSTGTSGNSNNQNRPTTELTGQVLVVADLDTNSLLVTTPTKFKEQVLKIIEQLDRPVPQVLIKVLVAEVTHERTNDFGADFSVLNTRATGKGLSTVQSLGNVAAQATSGGLIINLAEDNVNAALHALATEGKLDVLSRPYILASDNQPASIAIGELVPLITDTQITDTGQQLNTISYNNVGITVTVTPHVSPDGLVVLDVAPTISQLTGTTVPIGVGVSAPVIGNRSAQSRVAIRNGSTIVIGGMMQDQKTTTISKVPLLGDIPIIGQAFTRYQDDRTKTELLIFMTPHVALQPDTLKGMSEQEMQHTKLTPNAVEPGAFKDHLEGMHSGATPAINATQPAAIEIKSTPSTQPFEGVTISAPPQQSQRPPASAPPARRSSADPLK